MKNLLIKNGSEKYYGQLTLLDNSVVNIKKFDDCILIFTDVNNIESSRLVDSYLITKLSENVPSDVDNFINNDITWEFYESNMFFLCEEIMII